jgi:hypothetical protein
MTALAAFGDLPILFIQASSGQAAAIPDSDNAKELDVSHAQKNTE